MRKITFVFGYWPRRRRCFYSKRRLGALFLFGFCVLGLSVLINFLSGDKMAGVFGHLSGFSPQLMEDYVEDTAFSDSMLKNILQQGLPGLAFQKAQYISPDNLAESILSAVTTVNLTDPKALLESQFSYIEEMEVEAQEVASLPNPGGEEEIPEENPAEGGQAAQEGDLSKQQSSPGDDIDPDTGQKETPNAAAPNGLSAGGDNPLVGIYTTHNAENYSPTGEDAKVEGKNSGVAKVAEALESSLINVYGIGASRSQQIHDYPDWNLSYTKSKETAKCLLSKNPSIQILVDIHRDAGVKEKRTVAIGGAKAAQILFVVGSSQRLDHPNWKQNKAFAEKLHAKAQELYPGLSRGVRVQTGRYNQHLHPHAVLIEVGNVKNSLEEAEYSGKLMAHIFSEVLKDLSSKKL